MFKYSSQEPSECQNRIRSHRTTITDYYGTSDFTGDFKGAGVGGRLRPWTPSTWSTQVKLIKDHAVCQSIFSHLHGSLACIVLFWCCFSSGECDPREALLLDVSAAPKTWRDAVRTQHLSAGLHRREGSLGKKKKGSTHTERMQTQANCVLTNGLRFPAGCSCGLWMSKSISPPFHMRHNQPSAGKRGWWRGTDLTNLNKRSVGPGNMRANQQVTEWNKHAICIYRFAHLCNADAGRRLRVANVWLRLCKLRLYFNCGDWKEILWTEEREKKLQFPTKQELFLKESGCKQTNFLC